MSKYRSDEWIEWTGGECPVDGGVFVSVRYRDLDQSADYAEEHSWKHYGHLEDIIAYKIERVGNRVGWCY